MEESLPDADLEVISDGNEEETEEEVITIADSDSLNGVTEGEKESLLPVVGMVFDSYDDVYNFYNCYAKELGFSIRVRNSWCRKETKEKYSAVLCCSGQGLARRSETRSRVETRTCCPAMVRIRLVVGSFKWKVTEVILEHNHSISSASSNQTDIVNASSNQTDIVNASSNQTDIVNASSIQTDIVNAVDGGNFTSEGRDTETCVFENIQLQLREGDAQTIYNYFCRKQLISPDFFYLMDLDSEGCLGNVFWADARSRNAYSYFGDVVTCDSTYLANKYEVACVPFVGLNHHGQSVLLGCGLLADKTFESLVWLLKSWLTCMSGRPPSVIITDQCKIMQRAVMDVFPSARHCFSLLHIMDKAPQELQGVHQYQAIRRALNKAVYSSLTVDEFETTWKDMVKLCRVKGHEWLQMLYHDRKQWVPVFLKDLPFAGMSTSEQNESMHGFFDEYLSKQTSLKEFFGKYESALEKKRTIEAREEFDSIHSQPNLKTRCCFEFQMSKLYTKEIFSKFQYEVEELYSCFNTTQVHADGPNITYIVKERREGEGNQREIRNFEVSYDTEKQEVCCICGLFNFKGYLCRHALSVLNYNGVEVIPSQYILSRWRKDFKRTALLNSDTTSGDDDSQAQWYDRLHKCAVQIVEEGAVSQEHYKAALQALEESQNKVCPAEETESRLTPTCTTSNHHESMSAASTKVTSAASTKVTSAASTKVTSAASTKDVFYLLPKSLQKSNFKSRQSSSTINKSGEPSESNETQPFLVDVSDYFTTDRVFHSMDEVKNWAKTVGRQHGTVVCVQKSQKAKGGKSPRLYLSCGRRGKYITDSKGIRNTTSKKCECPFGLRCVFKSDGPDRWNVKVIVECGFHNHVLDRNMEGHVKLRSDELKIVAEMTKIGAKAKEVMNALKERDPGNTVSLKQVYNARYRMKMDEIDGQSPIQQMQKIDD